MAVAKKQIDEIIAVFFKHGVRRSVLALMLDDLHKVEAYKKNASFRDTIDRLSEAIFT